MSDLKTVTIIPAKRLQFDKMLRKSLAIEYGAMYAYEGHAKSLLRKRRSKEAWEIVHIRGEEADHIVALGLMMIDLNVRPNYPLIRLFKIIGGTISKLCYVTGYKLPMFGAKILEKIAVVNYREMAVVAQEIGRPDYSIQLEDMAAAEERHEAYFASKL